jgi:outer membrane protein TolC
MKKVTLLLLTFSTTLQILLGQQTFTLQQAQDYALKNANSITQSKYDEELAKIQIDQLLAIGLPQLNGSVQFQNFLNLPTSIIPGAIFGAPGQDVKVQFGVPYQMTAGVSGSQLLFDGAWLIGLQASKEYSQLAAMKVKKSEFEIKHQIAQSYYLAVIAKESILLFQEGKKLLAKSLQDTKALNKEGFVDEQSIDQLQYAVNEWESRIIVAESNATLTLDILKFSMGMPLSNEIELADNSMSLSAVSSDALMDAKFVVENNLDVQLVNKAIGLQGLNLKSKKATRLPSLAGFYNLQTQALRREFDFADTKKQWFPIQLWGVQMNVPILSGGAKYNAIKRAEVELAQMSATRKMVKEGATLAFKNAQTAYLTATKSVENAKASLALAQKIFEKTNLKFTEGIGTSFELTQVNNQILQAQGAYVQSLLQLLNAQDQLQKAINQ